MRENVKQHCAEAAERQSKGALHHRRRILEPGSWDV